MTRRALHRRLRRLRGFTLIEMLVVLTIVGILAAAALPLQELVLRRAQESALRGALREIRGALDEHRRLAEAGVLARGEDGTPWPASLRELVDGVPVTAAGAGGAATSETPARVYLLRRLPRDPFADPALPPEATWEVRGSSQPPGASGGSDVFDVRSRSPLTALDGSSYATW